MSKLVESSKPSSSVQIIVSDIVLERIGDQYFCDSLQIAKDFDRRHPDVLQTISNLECSPEFGYQNFSQSNYKDSRGKTQPKYRMTRDGFSFLALGFTGKEAAVFREKYIVAFSLMEAELSRQLTTRLTQLESKAAHKARVKGTFGYRPFQRENGTWGYDRVPKEECSEIELLVGGLLQKCATSGGLENGKQKSLDKIVKSDGFSESWVVDCLSSWGISLPLSA
jgi:Rha family phage regulatory protein